MGFYVKKKEKKRKEKDKTNFYDRFYEENGVDQ